MKRLPISIFILISSACANPAAAQEISWIRSVIQKITENELRTYVQALQDMGTRYAPSAGNAKAADYLKETLSSFGLSDVAFDEFDYYDTESGLYERTRNVVAEKPGMRQPEKIIVLGAHFDTVSRRSPDGKTSFQDWDNPAPGADDNGTGVAAVLAAARVLSGVDLDATVRFVAFSAEEGGIHGGAHYAAGCARKGEDIVAVINLDMIGFADQRPEDIDVLADPESEWLLDEMTNNALIYTPDLLVYRIVDGTYDGSDHGPFWNNGYPAVCLMEDYYPSNRHYHTPADTVETIDFSFALQCTRLAVATVAELAAKPSPGRAVADWKRNAGRKLLFTLTPSIPYGEVIDISTAGIHSRRRVVLDRVPEETWATPRFYPVAAVVSPSEPRVFVPMIRMRAPGDETENGVLRIVDPVKGKISREVPLGKFPGEGCFNSDGTRYFQPYWGELHIDVFDTKSFERIAQIASPCPVKKLLFYDRGQLFVGLSPETRSVLIVNPRDISLVKKMSDFGSPRDVAITNDENHALISDYAEGKITVLDVRKGEIVSSIDCAPRPLRLISAPQSNRVLALHESSARVEILRLVDAKLELEEELDLDEEIVRATFADSNDLAFFVSSTGQRLFEMDLGTKDIIWGMRTGDVRARSGVESILYIQR